jgi:hypothetical protein
MVDLKLALVRSFVRGNASIWHAFTNRNSASTHVMLDTFLDITNSAPKRPSFTLRTKWPTRGPLCVASFILVEPKSAG